MPYPAAAGRLASVSVRLGDHVVKGQPIARIVQTDIEQKHSEAVAVLGEKQREYAVLSEKVQSELAVKSQNFAKLEDALNQVIKATTPARRIPDGGRQESRRPARQGITRRGRTCRTRGARSSLRRNNGWAIRTIRSSSSTRTKPIWKRSATASCVSPSSPSMKPQRQVSRDRGIAEPEHAGDQPDRGPGGGSQDFAGLGARRRHRGARDRERRQHAGRGRSTFRPNKASGSSRECRFRSNPRRSSARSSA